MKTAIKTFFVSLIAAGLSACSVVSFFTEKGNRVDWSGLTVVAAEGANLNTAVALDLVFVRDDATLALLSAMPASKWFASRTDLAKTFPEGLSYRSMEVAPGQTFKLGANAFGPSRVVAVLMFADYLTPGEHRMRVDQLRGDLVVQLGARTFTVSAGKAPS